MYVVQFSYFDFESEDEDYDTVEYIFTNMEDAVRFGHHAAYDKWDSVEYDDARIPKDIYLFEADYREVGLGGNMVGECHRFDSGRTYLCCWHDTDKTVRGFGTKIW